MKHLVVPLLTLTTLALTTAACDSGVTPEAAAPEPAIADDHAFGKQAYSGSTVIVSPSGDVTGVTDAANIQNALDAVKASGGTVYLTDGDATTVDHYYSSRNIVSAGFDGVLRGESMDHTIIHAGRMSPAVGDGFQPEFSPWWSGHGSAIDELATVLQFDASTGSVTITDLTIEAKDDQPTDLTIDYYGVPATYITTLIEVLDGEHDTRIENVRLEGKATGAEGSFRGLYNVDTGLHVMQRGDAPADFGTGDLIIRNVEIENVFEAVLFMRHADGSMIDVEGLRARNVFRGIYAGGVFASTVNISHSEIAGHPEGWTGMELWNIPSGLEVTDNTISGGLIRAMRLWGGIRGATISRNTIRDLSGRSAAIWLRAGAVENTLTHNDFVQSGLPGWTAATPGGPGAIRLDAGTRDNEIFEMKFPAGTGKALCQMIWDLSDDAETTEYDGGNQIHDWQPCENLAERVAGEAELESGPGLHRWQ